MARSNLRMRYKIIRWYCLVTPFVGFGLYVGFQRPVLMVTIAASYAAIMLPLQNGITMYLQKKRLPAQLQPGWLASGLLRITFVFQLVLAFGVVYFTVL